jgi:regulator of sigma E protease
VSWALALIGIAALIVLHELGHFTVAKLVGMRVERFSLFFPPTIARVRRGETEYAIGAIPAGGYVKITGMNPEELETLEPEVARRAYYAQPPWKRIAVIIAGPGVNLLIAFLLFWVVLHSATISGAATFERLDPSVHAIANSTSVLAVAPKMPAAQVLRAGDRIVAIDGRRGGVNGARAAIASHTCAGRPVDGCRASRPVHLTVLRSGHTVTLTLYPRYNAEAKRMLIGIGFGSPKQFGVLAAAGASLGAMWHVTTQTLTGLGKALTSSKTRGEVSSIVGITADAHEEVQAGASDALVFLGFISLVLAVINLFPFLPLDGGHILWALAEKVRGRRISLAAMYRFSSVGIILLVFLVINGVSNDIGRLTG